MGIVKIFMMYINAFDKCFPTIKLESHKDIYFLQALMKKEEIQQQKFSSDHALHN